MTEQRPFKATSSRAAGLVGLPPDTPLNVVASIARHRRTINELRAIQKEYVSTPAASDAKLVGRENQDEFKAPPPPHV
jgi:hypothetical protein